MRVHACVCVRMHVCVRKHERVRVSTFASLSFCLAPPPLAAVLAAAAAPAGLAGERDCPPSLSQRAA